MIALRLQIGQLQFHEQTRTDAVSRKRSSCACGMALMGFRIHEPSCSQDITDSLDLTAVATEFIGAHMMSIENILGINVNFLVAVCEIHNMKALIRNVSPPPPPPPPPPPLFELFLCPCKTCSVAEGTRRWLVYAYLTSLNHCITEGRSIWYVLPHKFRWHLTSWNHCVTEGTMRTG